MTDKQKSAGFLAGVFTVAIPGLAMALVATLYTGKQDCGNAGKPDKINRRIGTLRDD
ncbi:MAG: hypothetical protein LBS57_09915 [Treponema sp.]|jgi:hypothetical protein|nr:hypothetical protein [Treponema sp.]